MFQQKPLFFRIDENKVNGCSAGLTLREALCQHEMGAFLTALPSPSLPLPSPFPFPPLKSRSLKYSKGVWGSAVRSLSGV